MPIIQITNLDGETRTVEFEVGMSLMETLRDQDYAQIAAICGGCCSCATCHVHIEDAEKYKLPAIEEDEQMLIELADNYDQTERRLSCQLSLTEELDGLSVSIVENQ